MRTFLTLEMFGLLPFTAAYSEDEFSQMWQRFQTDYRRTYSSDDDKAKHFAAFKANVLLAMQHNGEQDIHCTDLFDDDKCVFGITKFSDKSPDELTSRFGAQHRPTTDQQARVPVLASHSYSNLREELAVDWRSKGVVTAVNDQKECGSCWAFSIAHQMESAFAMATGKLLNLSEQQILSCDENCVDGIGDCGCDGGDVVSGSAWVQQGDGLPTLEDYPDTSSATGLSGTCQTGVRPAVKLQNYSYAVPFCDHSRDVRDERPCDAQDEVALAKVVASRGPVSISLTWGPGWWNYKGGVYDLSCSNTVADIDHAMQIVGYDMSGDKPYWIVRNTFGLDFGISGYIHMAMGKNKCGLANEAVLMEVESAISNSDQVVV